MEPPPRSSPASEGLVVHTYILLPLGSSSSELIQLAHHPSAGSSSLGGLLSVVSGSGEVLEGVHVGVELGREIGGSRREVSGVGSSRRECEGLTCVIVEVVRCRWWL